MRSEAQPVEEYIESLPEGRREAIAAVRAAILEHVPEGYAGLASQKNHMLDMGKSCVRFGKVDDLPVDVVGQAIARVPPEDFIAAYERSRRE